MQIPQMISESKPAFREVVHDYPTLQITLIIAASVLVGFPFLAFMLQSGSFDAGDWAQLPLPTLLLSGLSLFFYFSRLPLSVEVENDTLILRRGRPSSLRDRTVPLAEICALRRIPREEKIHAGLYVEGDALERWNLGGSRVLEIELKNTKRIHIASPRSDQLAALLHEITRLPVENRR